MAASITITGIPPYDGEYPVDFKERYFNGTELHEIKKLTGIRAGEIEEAANAGDYDIILAFALVAIRRSGKTIHPNVLWNAEAGSIDFDSGEEEEEEGEEGLPPPIEPDEPATEAEEKPSSGPISEPPLEPSPVTHLHTGTQG